MAATPEIMAQQTAPLRTRSALKTRTARATASADARAMDHALQVILANGAESPFLIFDPRPADLQFRADMIAASEALTLGDHEEAARLLDLAIRGSAAFTGGKGLLSKLDEISEGTEPRIPVSNLRRAFYNIALNDTFAAKVTMDNDIQIRVVDLILEILATRKIQTPQGIAYAPVSVKDMREGVFARVIAEKIYDVPANKRGDVQRLRLFKADYKAALATLADRGYTLKWGKTPAGAPKPYGGKGAPGFHSLAIAGAKRLAGEDAAASRNLYEDQEEEDLDDPQEEEEEEEIAEVATAPAQAVLVAADADADANADA